MNASLRTILTLTCAACGPSIETSEDSGTDVQWSDAGTDSGPDGALVDAPTPLHDVGSGDTADADRTETCTASAQVLIRGSETIGNSQIIARADGFYVGLFSTSARIVLMRLDSGGGMEASIDVDGSATFSLVEAETGAFLLVSKEGDDILIRRFDAALAEIERVLLEDLFPHTPPAAVVETGGIIHLVYERSFTAPDPRGIWYASVGGESPPSPQRLTEPGAIVGGYALATTADRTRMYAVWQADGMTNVSAVTSESVGSSLSRFPLPRGDRSFDVVANDETLFIATSFPVTGPGVSGNELNLASVALDASRPPIVTELTPLFFPSLSRWRDGFWLAVGGLATRHGSNLEQYGEQIPLSTMGASDSVSVGDDVWVVYTSEDHPTTRQVWIQRVSCETDRL